MGSLLLVFALAGASDFMPPAEIRRCSVRILADNPEGYFYPVDNIRDFVAKAEIVVRAFAVGPDSLKGVADPLLRRTGVAFRVTETLRGSLENDRFVLPGTLVNTDDFNRGEVPYRLVRPAGQRGDCFAQEYRVGAEYLFLLRAGERGLTPHWAALAPLNEQIRGSEDLWVIWVRRELGGTAPTRSMESQDRPVDLVLNAKFLSDMDKEAIFGGNMMKLLRISP